jgi:hypothetical protein
VGSEPVKVFVAFIIASLRNERPVCSGLKNSHRALVNVGNTPEGLFDAIVEALR